MKNNSKTRKKQENRISTLERAIKLLEYMETARIKSTLSDITAILPIPSGTAFNILKTLEAYGLIERETSSRQYKLGFRMFQLGNNVEYIRNLREVSLPFMRELTREIKETSNLGILFAETLYFLAIIESPFTTKTRSAVGSSLPLHAPAVGKALLAYQKEEDRKKLLDLIALPKFTPNTLTEKEELWDELDMIKKQGYAVDSEEVFLGTTCIAAPVFDSAQKITAALGITGDTVRIKKIYPH
ncbi:MAG: IclR family transcriptional regulator [Atribacterota bacterium]|jgi:DNA-binding IclR family transcriptional regulator|nr:IclR family transcriptional regulator [Atribacterota bacterium]MDD4895250.1 IclR family transcriptional regulator [Atribacterota bacterium]MDD5637567.1 IclR family transcriptional regulator [Atribacterota bacterium]